MDQVRGTLTLLVLAAAACGDRPAEGPGKAPPKAATAVPETVPEDPGRARRQDLLNDIIAKTREREAFSPIKNKKLGLDVEATSAALKEEFLKANNDEKLFYALVKLSNARKDAHLKVVPQGLVVPHTDAEPRAVPVKFMADFGTADTFFIFVADLDKSLPKAKRPGLGDRVLAVNGVAFDEWLRDREPWFRYSTRENLWWKFGTQFGNQRYGMGPRHEGDTMKLKLKGSRGATYERELPYEAVAALEWAGHAEPKYSGFKSELTTDSATLWLPTDTREVVLLQLHGFAPTLAADLEQIMTLAADRKLLERDVIVDATRGRGGAGSAAALQRLTSKRFKGTFGNVRISDALPPLLEKMKSATWDEPTEHGVIDWLEKDVIGRQRAAGQDYSDPVPFKLFHMPATADGFFEPHEVHFSGRVALIMGPHGGSNLDQFGAMFVDNELGLTIGLPLGGYSNTWEHTETLRMPVTDRPLVSYMWSIGHTLRPNGEVLEGNPAVPEIRFPVTARNFRTYHDQAIARVLARWAEAPPAD